MDRTSFLVFTARLLRHYIDPETLNQTLPFQSLKHQLHADICLRNSPSPLVWLIIVRCVSSLDLPSLLFVCTLFCHPNGIHSFGFERLLRPFSVVTIYNNTLFLSILFVHFLHFHKNSPGFTSKTHKSPPRRTLFLRRGPFLYAQFPDQTAR